MHTRAKDRGQYWLPSPSLSTFPHLATLSGQQAPGFAWRPNPWSPGVVDICAVLPEPFQINFQVNFSTQSRTSKSAGTFFFSHCKHTVGKNIVINKLWAQPQLMSIQHYFLPCYVGTVWVCWLWEGFPVPTGACTLKTADVAHALRKSWQGRGGGLVNPKRRGRPKLEQWVDMETKEPGSSCFRGRLV